MCQQSKSEDVEKLGMDKGILLQQDYADEIKIPNDGPFNVFVKLEEERWKSVRDLSPIK